MPTSGIVPIPCADVAEGMVQLPADSKRPSKLSGASARRAARRKVLEHVALGHGSRVVERKSPPLGGFTSLPVASLLSTATTATSSPMSKEEVTSPSPPFWKSTPPARRVALCRGGSCSCDHRSILAVSFVHLQTSVGSRVQDVHYVPFNKEAVACCSMVCCEE